MNERGPGGDVLRLLARPASRRRSLRWLLAGAGGAALPLAGCGGGGADADAGFGITTSTTITGAAGAGGGAACSVMPGQSGDPGAGDGASGHAGGAASALALPGIARSDIRASVAGAGGVAQGVPLTIRLQLVDVAMGCAAAAGAAVYLWHCTRDGGYSMYSPGIEGENYLRGVQAADAEGWVTFSTIFPGCREGRMPHVHVEVYPSLAMAAGAAGRVVAAQFTFPRAILEQAYTATGYAGSASRLARISHAADAVSGDGTAPQMTSVTGNPAQGYVSTLTVGVSL